jgi:hypothetical protein
MQDELISPYVYVGIRGADIPIKFRKSLKDKKPLYTQQMVVEAVEDIEAEIVDYQEVDNES